MGLVFNPMDEKENKCAEPGSVPGQKLPVERKRIRSFVLRQRRMTVAQKKAWQEHWPEFGLSVDQGMIDPEKTFNQPGPVVLEIGFGNGDSLAAMMAAAPEKNFIGIEVHRPGVGSLIKNVVESNLKNLKIYCDDAVLVLQNCIPDNSVDCVQLFFPDPWHKKKHHKRRLVQAEFIKLVIKKLKPGGRFHMATDWQNYAEHMMKLVSAEKNFTNSAGHGQYSPRPETRALTKFETRGQLLGHGVWDLIFLKQSINSNG